jgi:hypothetical protein
MNEIPGPESPSSIAHLLSDVSDLVETSTEYLDLRIQRLGLGAKEQITQGILMLSLFAAGFLLIVAGLVLLEVLACRALAPIMGMTAAIGLVGGLNLAGGVALALYARHRSSRS